MIISLPIEDRPRSYAFYRDAFGFSPIGEPDEDGVPEPLQFALTEDVRLMLIPTGGFGWVLGDHPRHPAAPANASSPSRWNPKPPSTPSSPEPRPPGPLTVGKPTRRPWAYVGTLTDPDGHVWMLETS